MTRARRPRRLAQERRNPRSFSVDTLARSTNDRRIQDTGPAPSGVRSLGVDEPLPAVVFADGAGRRDRACAAGGRRALAGGATLAGAPARVPAASRICGRTAARLASRGVSAVAGKRCRAACTFLEVVSVLARSVA